MKRVLQLGLVLLSLFLLSACGGDPATSGDDDGTSSPAIQLRGDSNVTIGVGENYTDPGATAYDSLDGDLTDKIVVRSNLDVSEIGTYFITYSVENSAGKSSLVIRTVNVILRDTVSPIITLRGDSYETTEIGTIYRDPGATAHDDIDGDITDQIVTRSNLDVTVPGTYYITYTVTDSAGNEATSTRTVHVSYDALELGVSVSNLVTEGEWDYYEFHVVNSGRYKVTLDHLDADIDLYVGTGFKPDSGSYTCRSVNLDADDEECILDIESSTDVIVGVYGYEGGHYSLKATKIDE